MIDPVGTGFSKAVGEAKDKDFWSVDAEYRVGLQVHQTVHHRQRPVELAEVPPGRELRHNSIGGGRRLPPGQGRHGLQRCDPRLDWRPISSFHSPLTVFPGNERALPYILPTYTAVAWYHKVLPDPPAELAPLLREARAFALGEYAHALALGSDLPDADRKTVIQKLHRYTGLSSDYLDKSGISGATTPVHPGTPPWSPRIPWGARRPIPRRRVRSARKERRI